MFIPILIPLLKFTQRARAFYYIMVVTVMVFIMNVFKLSYHDPRPFWVSSNIKAYGCSMQYGNPSGHSLNSMGIAMTVWLDYNHYAARGLVKYSSTAWRIFFLFLALLFGLSIGYSRVFMGVHSWN